MLNCITIDGIYRKKKKKRGGEQSCERRFNRVGGIEQKLLMILSLCPGSHQHPSSGCEHKGVLGACMCQLNTWQLKWQNSTYGNGWDDAVREHPFAPSHGNLYQQYGKWFLLVTSQLWQFMCWRWVRVHTSIGPYLSFKPKAIVLVELDASVIIQLTFQGKSIHILDSLVILLSLLQCF